jgi:hypothetical protein
MGYSTIVTDFLPETALTRAAESCIIRIQRKAGSGGVPVSTGSLHQGKRVEVCCTLFNPVARLNINANNNITVKRNNAVLLAA